MARQQVKASQSLAANPDSYNAVRASDRLLGTLKVTVELLLVIALFLLPLTQTRCFAQTGSDQYGQPYSGDQQSYGQQQPYSDLGQDYPQQEYGQQPSQVVSNDVQPLNAGQLEQLVAPIALYPDALVAQMLAASTYPQQVTDADRWRQAEGYAPPEQIAAGADVQPWDPSVKALTAFPQVLAQMDRNLSWTTALGNAYYNQPQDVLEAVQIMRRRAQSAGTLQSSPQEVVREDQGTIVLEPPTPQVVYVPAYNPWTVYGQPVTPYPGFSLLNAIGSFVGSAFGGSSFGGSSFGGSSPLRFGLGIAMSAFAHTPWGWLAWGLDWLGHELFFNHSDYVSHSRTVAEWGFPHHRFYAYAGRDFGRGFDRRFDRPFERSGDRFAHVRGDDGWRRGGFSSGPWHSFDRTRETGAQGRGERSFANRSFNERPSNANERSFNERALNDRAGREQSWREPPSRGFDNFRADRGFENRPESRAMSAYDPRASRMQEARPAYRSPNLASRGFDNRGFDSRSITSSKPERSGGLHLFGGGNKEKSFNGGHFGGQGFGNLREARAQRQPKFQSPKFKAPKAPKFKEPKFHASKSSGGGHSHGGGGHGGGRHHG